MQAFHACAQLPCLLVELFTFIVNTQYFIDNDEDVVVIMCNYLLIHNNTIKKKCNES